MGNCENILRLNNLVSTHSSYLILYENKAMRQSGLLSDDNRDVSEACVTRPLVRDWFSVSIQKSFFKCDSDLGLTTLVKHTINTGGTRPVKQPPRKVPMAFAEEEKKLIKQMEENGVIRKSSSPWAIHYVSSLKNSKIRPCADYRKLNSVTIQHALPFPRVQDCLDAVAESRYFSTFV